MAQRTLGQRVDSLEKTVRTLEKLPEQVARLGERVGVVEWQIVELRTEMRDGFSAIQAEMATKTELAALRAETKTELAGLRAEMATKADLGILKSELIDHADRGDRETRHYMRMLFEEYIGRLRVSREGDPEG